MSARRLAVALFARTPRSFLAAGYPLRSLTRNAGSRLTLAFALAGGILFQACEEPTPVVAVKHRPALPTFPFWRFTEQRDTAALGREIDSLTLVLSSDSTYAAGFLRRGQLAVAAYRPGNPLADFDKAIRLDSTLAAAYFSRGVMGQLLESHHRPRRGCRDIQKAASLGFQFPAEEDDIWSDCLIPEWDTLTVGSTWKFVPLSAYLIDSPFNPDDRKLIRQWLEEKSIPIDSVWVDPQHNNVIDTTTIELGLYFLSGIIEEIELENSGSMRSGNWSGRDGTLRINRSTGKSTYGLWQ